MYPDFQIIICTLIRIWSFVIVFGLLPKRFIGTIGIFLIGFNLSIFVLSFNFPNLQLIQLIELVEKEINLLPSVIFSFDVFAEVIWGVVVALLCGLCIYFLSIFPQILYGMFHVASLEVKTRLTSSKINIIETVIIFLFIASFLSRYVEVSLEYFLISFRPVGDYKNLFRAMGDESYKAGLLLVWWCLPFIVSCFLADLVVFLYRRFLQVKIENTDIFSLRLLVGLLVLVVFLPLILVKLGNFTNSHIDFIKKI